MITHQPSTMNTSREPRLESPYTTSSNTTGHKATKPTPRPHRRNQVKNHQPWLNPPIHHNSHTTLTNKPESPPNQPLIETKGQPPDQSRLPTTRSLIESLITQTNKPIPTQSPFTTPWEPTVKAKSSKQSQSPQSSSIHDWPIINQWITPPNAKIKD